MGIFTCYVIILKLAVIVLSQNDDVNDITRDYHGDIFTIAARDCPSLTCESNGRFAAAIPGHECKCQCAPSHQIFREDSHECINEVNDCPLVTFVRPYFTERVPVVSLPVSAGQLIHPGAHLIISGVAGNSASSHLSCQVESSHVMTSKGWQTISDKSNVFELYEDRNKTFLQWLGSDDTRSFLQQKLVLIRLNCGNLHSDDDFYQPCVAIRVGWVPGVSSTNSSVVSRGNAKLNTSQSNYLIIGLSLGILGLMYVLALMIYMRTKKLEMRKRADSDSHTEAPFDPKTLKTRIETEKNIINSLHHNRITEPSPKKQAYFNDMFTSDEDQVSIITTASNAKAKVEKEAVQQQANTLPTLQDRCNENEKLNQSQTSERAAVPERISRRGLQINPEFLEPENLAAPPPPAVEFLQRIREMISNAKGRIKNFRFRPTLLVIPEDDYFYQDLSACNDKPIIDMNNANHNKNQQTSVSIAGRDKKIIGTPIVVRKEMSTEINIDHLIQSSRVYCNGDIQKDLQNIKRTDCSSNKADNTKVSLSRVPTTDNHKSEFRHKLESIEEAKQDDSQNNGATVIEIGKSEEEITPPKTVVVHWDSGPRHHYRNGYKTSLELRKLENESEDIKPFFVKTNFEKTNPSNLLNVGDKVQIVVNIDELKELQEGHGGWCQSMPELIGLIGTVHRVTDRGDIRVQFEGCQNRWTFNPAALNKVISYSIGDTVTISDEVNKVKQLQKSHGEWIDEMGNCLGKVGRVVKVYPNGDLRVIVEGKAWTFNHACVSKHCEAVSSKTVVEARSDTCINNTSSTHQCKMNGYIKNESVENHSSQQNGHVICNGASTSIVFDRCGHQICCHECCSKMKKCIQREAIVNKVSAKIDEEQKEIISNNKNQTYNENGPTLESNFKKNFLHFWGIFSLGEF